MPPAKDSVSHSFRVSADSINPLTDGRWNGRWTNSCPVAQALIRTFGANPEHLWVDKHSIHLKGFYGKETPEQMRKWIEAYDYWRFSNGAMPKPENTRLSITLRKIPEGMPGTELRRSDVTLTD